MLSNVTWRKRRPYYDIYVITVIREQECLKTITGFMVEKATTLHSFLNMYLPQPHDYDVKIALFHVLWGP